MKKKINTPSDKVKHYDSKGNVIDWKKEFRKKSPVVNKELKKKLEPFKNKNVLVFAPYGIGGHIDHLIVRKVCEELFDNVILYSDFPYNIRSNSYGKAKNNQQICELETNNSEKTKLIALYKTQFQGLFPNKKVPVHKEVFFMKTAI